MPAQDNPRPASASPPTVLDRDALTRNPAWLPVQILAPGTVRWLRLTESGYRSASFLDARIQHSGLPQGLCPLSTATAAAGDLAPSAQFIFHIGHVGSTLLSRLAGEHPDVFSVREPTLLRAAAQTPVTSDKALTLPQQLALLSRTWRPGQRALIKTTSFVNEIAADLLACAPDSRAILLFTPALTYLRAILAGPNSRLETRTLAPSRLERVQRRAGGSLPAPHREGEWVAMSWLCEMSALEEVAARFDGRVRWMDFEGFLLEPAAQLAAMLASLGLEPDRRIIAQTIAGPLMQRYAKAPEHPYDRSLRREVLAQAARDHAWEIQAGLDWLAGLRTAHPLIAAALAR